MSDTTTVWVDESARLSVDGFVYAVAGVRQAAIRSLDRLDALRFPDQKYLHWRDEPSARRREFVSVANELVLDVTVAVVLGVAPKRQEAARSSCLAAVVQELLQAPVPVSEFNIEVRGHHLDVRDEFTINDVVRRLRHFPTPTTSFVAKTSSPLLWVADAVSAMAATHFSDAPGADHWWRSLRPARLTILYLDA